MRIKLRVVRAHSYLEVAPGWLVEVNHRHFKHSARLLSRYIPASHRQLSAVTAPVAMEVLPAMIPMQLLQMWLANSLVNFPFGQLAHSFAPRWLLCDPFSQL